MKQFLDFAPIVIFALVYWRTDIYIATKAMMIASAIQIVLLRVFTGKVEKAPLITFAAIMLFGSLTLIFHNDLFIMWKPTVVNWAFAAILLGGHYFGSENLLEKMLGKQLPLPDVAWTTLTFGWSLGFFLAGGLNLLVAYNFEQATWVTYKLFGGPATSILYIFIMIVYLVKGGYINTGSDNDESATSVANEDNPIPKKD